MKDDSKIFIANALLLLSIPLTIQSPPSIWMSIVQILAISIFVSVYSKNGWWLATWINVFQIVFWIILLIVKLLGINGKS
ncbi:MAG TPA: hypothetical protein PKK07_02165 [bacterium]|nr:hypothetical protein [bacterium]